MVLDELTGKPGVFFEMSTQVRAALDLIEKVVKAVWGRASEGD